MIKRLFFTILTGWACNQLTALSVPQGGVKLLSGGEQVESSAVIPSPLPVPSPASQAAPTATAQSDVEKELQTALWGELKHAKKVLAVVHKDIADHQAWISGLKDKLKACNASYGIAMKEIKAYAAEEAANAKHVQEVLLQRKLEASIKANMSKEEAFAKEEATFGNTSAGPEKVVEKPATPLPKPESKPAANEVEAQMDIKQKSKPLTEDDVQVAEKQQPQSQPGSNPSAPVPMPGVEKVLPTEKAIEEEMPSIDEMREQLKVITEQHRELLKLKAELLAEVNSLRKSFDGIMDIIVFWQKHKDEKKRGLLAAAGKEEEDAKKVKEAYSKMLEVNKILSKPEGDDAIE